MGEDRTTNVFSPDACALSFGGTERKTTNEFSPTLGGGWRWLNSQLAFLGELLRGPTITIRISWPATERTRYVQGGGLSQTVSEYSDADKSGENGRGFLRQEIVFLFVAADIDANAEIGVADDLDAFRKIFSWRNDVKVVSNLEIKAKELIPMILEYAPAILHFDGHGNETAIGVHGNEDRSVRLVSPEDLRNVIEGSEHFLKLVYYDCCLSEQFAKDASRFVPSAIGMRRSVGVLTARSFARTFYSALARGMAVEKAFSIAHDQLKLADHEDEMDVPCLYPERDLQTNATFILREAKNVSD